MKRTPTTYTTLDRMAREIRLPRTAEAVARATFMLHAFVQSPNMESVSVLEGEAE